MKRLFFVTFFTFTFSLMATAQSQQKPAPKSAEEAKTSEQPVLPEPKGKLPEPVHNQGEIRNIDGRTVKVDSKGIQSLEVVPQEAPKPKEEKAVE